MNVEILVYKETQEQRELQDQRDQLELQGMMEKQVLTVIGVPLVLQDLLERADQEVFKVYPEDPEPLVTRDTKVIVEQQEVKVQQARMERRGRQVIQAVLET